MDWTDEAVAMLRALWAEGHSGAEIGRRMGCGKNAIVGKAHRLNLPTRPSPIQPKLPTRPERNPRHTLPTAAPDWRLPPKKVHVRYGGKAAVKQSLPPEPERPAPPAKPTFIRGVTAATVYRTCRFGLWPNGQRPTHRYCDAPTVTRADGSRSSWCAVHYASCHTADAAPEMSERAA